MDGDGRGESLYMYTVPTQQDTQQIIINFTDSDAGDFAYTIVSGASYPEMVNISDIHLLGEDGFAYGYMHMNV